MATWNVEESGRSQIQSLSKAERNRENRRDHLQLEDEGIRAWINLQWYYESTRIIRGKTKIKSSRFTAQRRKNHTVGGGTKTQDHRSKSIACQQRKWSDEREEKVQGRQESDGEWD